MAQSNEGFWRQARSSARLAGLGWLVVAFGAAAVTAAWVAGQFAGSHLLVGALLAALSGAGVVYLFAYALDNASLLDPVWMAFPMGFVLALEAAPAATAGDPARQVAVLALVLAWGLRRLTAWGRGWQGMGHESWRHGALMARFGRIYWVGAFLAWAALPTLIIFLLCLPLFPAMTGGELFGGWDWLGILLGAMGILYQAASDRLLALHRSKREAGVLTAGPYALSRHPTYFGELVFWVGIFFFGVAGKGGSLWTGFGLVLFVFYLLTIVLPRLDAHLESGRPGYRRWARRTSGFVPWIPGR